MKFNFNPSMKSSALFTRNAMVLCRALGDTDRRESSASVLCPVRKTTTQRRLRYPREIISTQKRIFKQAHTPGRRKILSQFCMCKVQGTPTTDRRQRRRVKGVPSPFSLLPSPFLFLSVSLLPPHASPLLLLSTSPITPFFRLPCAVLVFCWGRGREGCDANTVLTDYLNYIL